ncbi:hypothetical protein ZWY2020_047388 [Hordeum vulgare]|nr:hypothetical protein ZWY2020_047388 [Hordeum vulgare]
MRCGWRRRRRSRRCGGWRRAGTAGEEEGAYAHGRREVMDMMLRLQREKAEVKMELRQFRRFADEKMALDSAEIDHLRALVARRARHLACARSRLHAYQQTCLCLVIPLPDADDSEQQDHNDGQEGSEEDAMGRIWSAGSASSSTARMGIY